MASPYAGRVAVITGASRGLGAGMAKEFQRLGLKLGLCSRSPPCLPTGDGVVAAEVDVCDGEAVSKFADAVVSKLGHIDLWINNSGTLGAVAPQRDLTSSALQESLATNVVGVLHGSQSFVRHVRAREGGNAEAVLINISSGAARSGYAGWTAYCASKGAVDRMTECVQLEEEGAGLRAYSVAPGIVDTAMQEQIRSLTADEFPMVEKFKQFKEADAFNTPEFVAQELLAIAFDPAARPATVACSLARNQVQGRR